MVSDLDVLMIVIYQGCLHCMMDFCGRTQVIVNMFKVVNPENSSNTFNL